MEVDVVGFPVDVAGPVSSAGSCSGCVVCRSGTDVVPAGYSSRSGCPGMAASSIAGGSAEAVGSMVKSK